MRSRKSSKRQSRTVNSYQRNPGHRQPCALVLIVCEGKKTEPNYFKGLRDDLQLTNIKITNCPTGTDPMSIVDYALELYSKDYDYDNIYCVFDKEHNNYQVALDKIHAHYQNGIPIYAITSVPCFEYWLLLHFIDSSRPYKPVGKKSAGDQLVSAVKKYIPDYHKGHKSIFDITKHNLNIAVTRAKKIEKLQRSNRSDNPSTKVYQLVTYLQNIKK